MNRTILMFMHDFRGGGAEKVSVQLANGMAREGHEVVVVVVNDQGPMKELLATKISVISLSVRKVSKSIIKLAKLLKCTEYDLLISHMTHINIAAILASAIAGKTRQLCIVEHNMMQQNFRIQRAKSVRLAYLSTKLLYKLCPTIIAVSEGVKNGVVRFAGVNKNSVKVIYNPVVDFEILADAQRDCSRGRSHIFMDGEEPVILGIGSLTEQKNFSLLIDAVIKLNNIFPVKCIILGEGPLRQALQDKIDKAGFNERIHLEGYVKNPLTYLYQSDIFVLSSSWEGLPTVLIEALATGVKVVSTDCDSGPREILQDGRYGTLVRSDPSGEELAFAIESTLKSDGCDARSRVEAFSINSSVSKYIDLIS